MRRCLAWLRTLARLVRPPGRPRRRTPLPLTFDPTPLWARGYSAEDV
jgi:hypothetical protein